VLKQILKGAIEERQLIGISDIKMLIAECASVKNNRINHGGLPQANGSLAACQRT